MRIDASKKVPTAELILTPAVEIDKVIIRISAGDYKKSPCLAKVKKEVGVPILSDVHCRQDVKEAAEVLDIIQIPAFLSRQT